MKVIQLFIVFLSFNLFYGQEKPILKIDDDEVYISEFEQIYWKNKKENIATKEDLDNYDLEILHDMIDVNTIMQGVADMAEFEEITKKEFGKEFKYKGEKDKDLENE